MVVNFDKLKKEVECSATGFRGIAMVGVVHANGCIQYLVQPRCENNNKRLESHYMDTNNLKVVGDGISKMEEKDKDVEEEPRGGEFDNLPMNSITEVSK